MALKTWNIVKANAENAAAQDILTPQMEKAGIKTITLDGKAIAYADAPLAAQMDALFTAKPTGTDLQPASELLRSNDVISKELEKTNTELAIAQTSVATLTRDTAEAKDKLVAAQTSVQTLTVQNADLTNRLQAAVNQFTANANDLKAQKAELAAVCVAAGCLELKVVADATEAQKTEAAMELSHGDLLKAYRGAVNAAVAKTGVNFNMIPGQPAGTISASAKPGDQLTGIERALAVHQAKLKTA